VAWKVSQAKQRLSEVLRRAQREPQVIEHRNRAIAVIMSPAAAERALKGSAPSMRDALADLRRLCTEADYTLQLPGRANRDVSLDWPTHVPRRHQRLKRAG
jgi:prevent-host-death family protein